MASGHFQRTAALVYLCPQPVNRCSDSPLAGPAAFDRIKGSRIVTDQEKQKAEEMISRLETAVGQLFPRDGGNASLITGMIQSLNGLRSLLGLVRPH
jgi:hypothetical protein